MLGISFLTWFILAVRVLWDAKLVISGILSSIVVTLALYTSFLTTSFYTTSLSLRKSTGTVTNILASNLSSLLFKLLKLIGAFLNLSISKLSISHFNLAKSTFLRSSSFWEKTIVSHNKYYYYFSKSNIPAVKLIVGFRNTINVSSNMSSKKLDKQREVVFTKYRQFLSAFYCFWRGRVLESGMDK